MKNLDDITAQSRTWRFSELAGRVMEASGWNQSACLTLAAGLIRESQEEGRLCAWIMPGNDRDESLFFPPDFADSGIICSMLPILRCRSNADGFGLAEKLLRSGGFGLVVIDLTSGRSLKGRVVGRVHVLARKFSSLVLCLTRSPTGSPSLDPMVFLHVHVDASINSEGRIGVMPHIEKDKTHIVRHSMELLYDAPLGLC